MSGKIPIFIGLDVGHEFLANRLGQRPDVALLLPSVSVRSPDESMLATEDRYRDVLKQLAAAGVRQVYVDAGYLALTPRQKADLVRMTPNAGEIPGIESVHICGVKREGIYDGAPSETEKLTNSRIFVENIDDAIAALLR